MVIFRKSGKRTNNIDLLRQRYAVYFSSEKLFKGVTLTCIGWLLVAYTSVAFQHLVINNSIFLTNFVIFSAAFIPLFIWSLFKGKNFFVCSKPYLVFTRALLAILVYYIHLSVRVWITDVKNSMLFNIDALCVPLLIYILFKKKTSKLAWAGILLGFFGLGLLNSLKLDIFSLPGLFECLLCFISGISVAVIMIISCYIIRDDPPLRQAFYTVFCGLVIAGIGMTFCDYQMPSKIDLIYMVIQGLFFSAWMMIFLNACDSIEPHVMTTIGYLMPLVMVLMNTMFKFYHLNVWGYLGVFMTIVGIVFVILSTRLFRKEEDLILL